jgi:Tfp pilus assembly protein PilO
MSRLYHRQKQKYLFGTIVAVFLGVSILAFLILYLPLRSELRGLEASIDRFTSERVTRATDLDRLQQIENQLGESRTERLRFLAARIVPREEGFAAILPDLERLAQIAGIRRSQVRYSLDPVPQFGVYRIQIDLPVQGSYLAVTRFIRELETAETLFILDSIGLNRSQTGELDLSLGLTTFFSYGS